MDVWSLVGISASVIVISSYLPQIIKSLKTKHTKDISTGWPVLFVLASFLWFLYGVHLKDIIIISVNLILTLMGLVMLSLKLRFG